MLIKKKIAKDAHFEHYWKRCDLCRLNYDIIGKMDTFNSDSKYIMEKIRMNTTKAHIDEIHNVSSGESSEDLAKKLFANLSKKLVKKLYELYKIDFEMFDYDYKQFLT